MKFRIHAGESGAQGLVRVQEFIVEEEGHPNALYVNASVRGIHAADLFRIDRTTSQIDEFRLKQALALHLLPILDAGLGDGSLVTQLESEDGQRRHDIRLDHEQLADAAERAESKRCRYRVHERGDDYCDAGIDDGVSTRWPTSRAICNACNAPDSTLACSNLHHIRTASASAAGGSSIIVVSCECDLAKPNQDPARCTFGGLDCWERHVDIAPPASASPPPLATHESIDYFDAVWRNAFGRPLVKLSVVTPGGVLATPCGSSQDFQAKLSALGEVFNAFDVQHEAPGVNGSLAKMRAKLAAWGEDHGAAPEDVAKMEAAVLVFQRALGLRAGQQHGSARDRYEQAVRALGLSLPPASYSDEWNRLQNVIHAALADLRQFIREHV